MASGNTKQPSVGAPKIKLDDLPKGWQKKITDLASDGASIVELAVELGIARQTFYNLSEREPEFLDTIKRCKELSEVWWQKQGRTNLTNKDFNYTGWYMNMKNRFGWKDRTDLTSDDKVLPSPIMGGMSVHPDDSHQEDSSAQKTD